MNAGTASRGELAVLTGGPADGLRMYVRDRPSVVQVTYPCAWESPTRGVRAEAVYVYRRDHRTREEPLRYGFDGASP
ncbi:hypothetical protein ACFYZ9_09695 [Streptomyces sp. NPDC001691]|uniref:hypothetical protein n=1 Tax=unclassified Streptomyces TaxID=2593676 RepID=UPI000DE98BFF|nr:hypothetical protein [Streptomyces sp. SDr-06]RCH70233.1 hypothetical protein DT019_01675 [Streptomyces sp. SDr-06]